ncbi:MAG: hypothetical protein EBT86_00225 [Actinobacteria bacterium]|nr:hypothetical protein [Actinomycetota bacterium]
MHLPPNVWGPIFWHTIHIIALGYPIQEPPYQIKRAAKDFYESLASLIPCPVCREHYAKHLSENPISPSLDKRADLFRWTVNLHNVVNKSLGKPQISENEAIAFYTKLGERNRSPIWNPADFKERDMKSFLQGIIYGVLGGAFIAGAIWAVRNYQTGSKNS